MPCDFILRIFCAKQERKLKMISYLSHLSEVIDYEESRSYCIHIDAKKCLVHTHHFAGHRIKPIVNCARFIFLSRWSTEEHGITPEIGKILFMFALLQNQINNIKFTLYLTWNCRAYIYRNVLQSVCEQNISRTSLYALIPAAKPSDCCVHFYITFACWFR